jgi:CheY-like chemotaxis protein
VIGLAAVGSATIGSTFLSGTCAPANGFRISGFGKLGALHFCRSKSSSKNSPAGMVWKNWKYCFGKINALRRRTQLTENCSDNTGCPILENLRLFMTKQCVLLADDDKDEVYLLRWAFRHAGLQHKLIAVPDGAAVIEYLQGTPPFSDRAQFPFPSLLILDLKMPKVNGFNVLAWLRIHPEHRSVPVVVLSCSVFQSDYQRVVELGAREFLSKPFDIEEMVTLVKGLHARWLACPQISIDPRAVRHVSDVQIGSELRPPPL